LLCSNVLRLFQIGSNSARNSGFFPKLLYFSHSFQIYRKRMDMESQPLLQQQQQEGVVPLQDSYMQSRTEALQNVESTIHELSSIFNQLATLVSQQGEIAIRYFICLNCALYYTYLYTHTHTHILIVHYFTHTSLLFIISHIHPYFIISHIHPYCSLFLYYNMIFNECYC